MLSVVCACGIATTANADMMSSWTDNANRTAITDFVTSVTTQGSDSYLAPTDRIAVFDNDGPLWTEKPTVTEVFFILDQVKALANSNPEWKTQEPYSIILEKGMGSLREIGLKGILTALPVVYAQLGDEEFNERATNFVNGQHPTAERTYLETTYAPMVDLTDYLRENGFEVFIVSGGSNRFMRTFAETAYGVPSHQVIGSAMAVDVTAEGETVTLSKQPKLAYFNNTETKVRSIVQQIGKRPTIVVGNSDGDLSMIRYALQGDGPRLGLLVNHDDDVREAAYDRGAKEAMAAAAPDGDNFLAISMKDDFAHIWKP